MRSRPHAPAPGRDAKRGAVAQHLRDAWHDFGGVVTNGDEGVGAKSARVFDGDREGFGPSLLAEIRQQRDLAAKELLELRAEHSEHGSRSHRDAADDAETRHDVVFRQLIFRGCDEVNRRGHDYSPGMPWYDVRKIAAFVTRSVGLVTTNVRPRGTDRDQLRVVIIVAYALVLTATLSCQQAERRDAAGEVAATLPARPAPVPTPDVD